MLPVQNGSRLRAATALFTLTTIFAGLVGAQVSATPKAVVIAPLAPPNRSVDMNLTYRTGYSFPVYQSGMLVTKRTEISAKTEKNIFVHSPAVPEPSRLSHWGPGGDKTILTAVAKGAGDTVISSGWTRQGTRAEYFIARSDSAGNNIETIRTKRYLASAVCANKDGSMWALGTRPQQRDGSYFYALRRYDAHGNFIEGTLRTQNVGEEYSLAAVDPRQVFLSCQEDDVYVFNGPARQLFHYSSATKKLNSWDVGGPAGISSPLITGFATSASGRVFLSLREGQHGRLGQRGLFQLVGINSQKAEWRAVPGTLNSGGLPGKFWLLLGIDGNDLVYVTTALPGRKEAMNWSTIN